MGQAPFPFAQTFLLHSKPGSNRTVYLDFDGGTLDSGFGFIDLDQMTVAP